MLDPVLYEQVQYDSFNIGTQKRFIAKLDKLLYPLPDKKLSLQEMQEIVGGYIEYSPIPLIIQGQKWKAIWNEEARIKQLPRNTTLTDLMHTSGKTLNITIYGVGILLKGNLQS